MSARLVRIFLPEEETAKLEGILEKHSRRFWRESIPGELEKYSCLVQQRYTQRLLDELESTFVDSPRFTAFVAQLEAVVPSVAETPETELPIENGLPPPTPLERFFSRDRLSTDELYDDIEESLHIRPTYLLMVLLSAVIAGLGMRSGQTAVVIGAMIIAPLLGPSMGMALAGTTGNPQLGLKSVSTLAAGCVVAVVSGILLGLFVDIDPMTAELRNRTIVQPGDIALALACGAAGVLAFSKGASLTLVGVMIAVALVPPLTAAGIYTGAGYPVAGGNALFLFAVNLVCLNVSGIVLFLVQGLPPKSWRMTGSVLFGWAFLLFLLLSMMAGRLLFGLGSLELVTRYIGISI